MGVAGRMTAAWALAPCLMAPVAGAVELELHEIAEGIFVHQGVHEDVSADNRGDIANIGFIVGQDCVAVVDTGGGPEVGDALLAALRQETELPVCYVINTHVHPDHLLGNAAFVTDDTRFVGHHRLPAQLEARGPYYLETASRLLGEDLGRELLVPPDRTVEDTLVLDLGGRELELRAMPTAHTDTDLVIRDRATDTLWLSDLLFVDRVPSLDGSLRGWLAVMNELEAEQADRVVPGHGPVSVDWPEAAAAQRRYLETLLDQTRQAIAAGATMEQAVGVVARSEKDAWKLFSEYNERNVQNAYSELEWE